METSLRPFIYDPETGSVGFYDAHVRFRGPHPLLNGGHWSGEICIVPEVRRMIGAALHQRIEVTTVHLSALQAGLFCLEGWITEAALEAVVVNEDHVLVPGVTIDGRVLTLRVTHGLDAVFVSDDDGRRYPGA